LPYLLGNALAWREGAARRLDVLLWGVLGVVCIMLATYLAGEFWDQREDRLSVALGKSRFAGGSGMLQQAAVAPNTVLAASVLSVALALCVGTILQYGYRTGPWTLPLGILGAIGGFFYSSRPLRWVGRGWGELWIGFCYGWLPVAAGCYLQGGAIPAAVHWLSLPIALTIFNVILLNEFPDYEADLQATKRNLAGRLGRERAAFLYVLIAALSWMSMSCAARRALSTSLIRMYLPVLILSVGLAGAMLRGWWRDRRRLEWLCGANLIVNLGTTATLMLNL